MLELLAQTGLNALYAASYTSLVAVGLVLIFGVMGVINFAHGELFMLGAYAIVALYADLAFPFFAAVAIGLVFVGAVGLAMERALFRPLRDNPLGGLVASIGFLLILQALAVIGFGVRMEHVPPVTQEVIVLSDHVHLAVPRLYVIIAAVVLLTALWAFLSKTRFGWALRASAQDDARPREERVEPPADLGEALAGEGLLAPGMRESLRQLGDTLAALHEEALERALEALESLVEPLALVLQNPHGVRQAPAEALQNRAPLALAALPGRLETPLALQDLRQELGAHRHGHLGGRRRSRRAAVGREVDQGHVGLVPDRGDERNAGGRRGAHHDLLVEGPEVFQAAAAPRHDQQVRARRVPAARQGVEALDRGGDLRGRALALDENRPDQNPAREAVGQAVQDVADHRAARRGHHADDLGQEGQGPLARVLEEALGGELALPLLEQLEQRALAGELELLDHELVFRAPGVARHPAGGDDLHAVLGRKPEPPGDAAPAHPVEHRVAVLERHVEMTRGGALEAGDLAAHPDPVEAPLQGALDRLGDLRNAVGRQVGRGARRRIGRRAGRIGGIAHDVPPMLQDARRPDQRGAPRVVPRAGLIA